MSTASDLDIAVIGVSCEFGGAYGLDEYWDMMNDQHSFIRRLDVDEMEDRGALQQFGADDVVLRISPLKDIAIFDSRKFGISNRDANIVDPQLRLMLKHASQALRSSGYDPALYWGQIGVFGSASISMEWAWEVRDSLGPGRTMAISEVPYVERDFYITRLAYHLGLRGPAVLVNSACSSSHVAIHMAIQSLLAGDCDIALAGASSVRPFWAGYHLQEGGFFSPTGVCAPFSDTADGTVPGEGAAFVVLKRLETAREDGDKIFCVIKATAINNDGNQKPGYAGPSERGQAEVVEAALTAADIASDKFVYVETHGTGTKLGDPIEISALNKALKRWGKSDSLHIGSVKANIGHTDVVAGLAGLVKAALILIHRQVPPEIPIASLNELCRFDETPFERATVPVDLPSDPNLCAGISSFGIGGTNGHIVIEAGDSDFPLASSIPEAGTRFDGILRKRNTRRTDKIATVDDKAEPLATSVNHEAETEIILSILKEHAPKANISLNARLQDLGIDSIGVVMITEELDTQFGRTLSAARFAELSTVADLIEAMRPDAAGEDGPRPERNPPVITEIFLEEIPDESNLTLGQNRFFYPQVTNPESEMCASILELVGTVSIARVKSAVANTILRHQALRSRYLQDEQRRWHVHYDDYPADGYFRKYELGSYEDFDSTAYCNAAFSKVDFSKPPLFFAHLLKFDDGKCLIILFTHKVMLDGNSFRLLANDFVAFYQSDNPALPSATPISIYSQYQNAWFEAFDPEQDRLYWSRPEWSACGSLPVDREAGVGGKSGEETEARKYLSAEETSNLLSRLKAHKISLMDLILYSVTAFATAEANSEWTQMSCTFGGRSDVLGVTGRDFSGTVGLLALNGLLLLQTPSNEGIIERVEAIKRQLAEIPLKGLSYFIGSAAPVKRGVHRINVDNKPLFNREITVNFHGYEGYNTPQVDAAQVIPLGTHIHVPPEYDRWSRLELNFGFEDGRFYISCKYSSGQYDEQTISRFVTKMRDEITSLPA
ncbi:MAG: beta-ketoacyl synthase N-terminal-like domain-containing protein [Asticcacaulis sp.]|uniref:beta-ketoacyl synthase N-terminal-like domain-containing protein n=1 Tax=Asticcacaulis sp. TaxID=1872648 RepID=UPI003F7C4468